ncbi:MAG: hypothetical protein ACRDRV_11525 [Pseudonocardiaceae bacterium]
MADSAEVITGKRLLDAAKRHGFMFARIAPGPDGPIEGVRENDQWRDVIHIGGSPAVVMHGGNVSRR